MSAERIEEAKRNAELARERMESTVHALQARLHPKVLATDAWEGVRDKGNDLADGAVETVKKRPAAVSAAAGAFVLFLARAPLKRAVTRMLNGRKDKHPDLMTTKVTREQENYRAAASPWMDRRVKEGVQ